MFIKKIHELCNKRNFKKTNTQEKFGIHGVESSTAQTQPEKVEFVAKPPPDVRLILFRECKETSNRNIVFDSKSIQKTQPKSTFCSRARQANDQQQQPLPQYQVVNEPKDWHVLGEMLFGTVGMASKATSLKIHLMRDSPSLMLSRVYSDTSTKDVSTPSLERGLEAFRNNSLSSRRAKTLPVATPETPTQQLPSPTVAHSLTNSLTRLARSDSSSSILSVFGSLSTPVMRVPNVQGTTRAHSLPQTARNGNKDTFMLSNELTRGRVSQCKSKIKIGLAVVLMPEPSSNNDFNKFVFNHFPIIESYMTRLKEDVENALHFGRRTNIEKFDFLSAMMTALQQFTEHLTNLYCAPRLIEPMWKTLTMKSDIPWRGDPSTVECLISDIAMLFRNNNRNNFTISLISAVLTYHLGWVSSVGTSTAEEANNREMVNYNPLWAQLGDIYGAMCSPTRVSKTVITGEQHQKVSTIVSMLSYFIRCAKVEEVLSVPEVLEPQNVLSYEHSLDMKEVNGVKEDDGFILVSTKQSSDMTTSNSNKSMSNSLSSSTEMKKKQTNLHRSRSSPFGGSNHNNASESNLCLHRNTSSTDILCRSRLVQSRRKSNNCANPIRFSICSDTIEIPTLKDRLDLTENRSSYPNKQTSCNDADCRTSNKSSKTHKRVNSEPFKIYSTEHKDQPCKLHCQESYVGRLEPKIEQIIHVQSDVTLARRNIKENIPPPPTSNKTNSDVNSNNINDNEQMLRRNSSGKSKLATRRCKLHRTPSVQLKHEDFEEYFEDDSESLPNIDEVNKVTESVQTKVKPVRPAPPLPSRPPVHKGNLYPALPKAAPVVATRLTPDKPTPPKLPSTGPVGDASRKALYPKLPPLPTPATTPINKPARPKSLFMDGNTSPVKKIYPVLPPVNNVAESPSERESLSEDREEWPLTNIHKNILKPNNINFGYSNLMADYSPKYLWNFALFGARPMPDLPQRIADELEHSVKRPVLDESVAEAVCIHADVDRNTVSVYSSHRLHSGQISLPALSSKLVANMIERVVRLYTMKVPADFCLMQLESELTQLVLKSRMLAEYVQGQTRVAVTDLSKVLGIEKHDLPLLMAIASCHSPQVGAVI